MKHFTISELLKSETAISKKIWNGAPKEAEDNLVALVAAVLDPVREAYGRAITVTSGYRCASLNKAIGGVASSQHLKGEAADIAGADREETAKIGKLIAKMGNYDQLIFESSDRELTRSGWIHVSWKRRGDNRHEILRKDEKSGKFERVRIS